MQPMIGEPAPPFTLTATDGSAHSLADFRGRYVVLHFGTSW
jgi:peroxiredoxin